MIGKLLCRRYRVEGIVGTGGMAVVYRALDVRTGRTVAIKMLRDEYSNDKEFLRRFEREARAAETMHHPNVVALLDTGEEDGHRFIVMEYVDGPTVKDFLQENGRLNAEQTVAIAVQVCRALTHAHERNIVHRDIKPQNILIDNQGSVKVADFGIARAIGAETMTATDAGVLGSVYYFSPEQARGGLADFVSDLYSLGIVLYEMVTGQVPFEGETPVVIALAHVQQPPRRPRRFFSDIPVAMEEVILKAIAKEKSQRYQSAAEMERDLLRVLSQPRGGFVQRAAVSADTRTLPAVATLDAPVAAPTARVRPTPARMAFIALLAVLVVFLAFFAGGRLMDMIGLDGVAVPRLQGATEQEAREKLEEAGLLASVTSAPHDTMPVGLVSDQDPIAHDRVEKGATVRVVISSGPSMAVVPSVINMSLAEAQEWLKAAGFKVGTPLMSDNPRYDGKVFRQEPAGNAMAMRGDEVVIWVGMAQSRRRVPLLVGLSTQEATALLHENGLVVGTVREFTSSDHPAGTVLGQTPSAEEDVENGSAVALFVSRAGARKRVTLSKVSIPDAGARVVVTLALPGGAQREVHNFMYTASGPRDIDLDLEVEEPGPAVLIVTVNGREERREEITFEQSGS